MLSKVILSALHKGIDVKSVLADLVFPAMAPEFVYNQKVGMAT